MTGQRYLVWFSAGAASAVTAKLVLSDHGHDNVVIAYTDPGSEHPDNERFLADCERWFDHEVIRLRSKRYSDTWQVFRERRFLSGPSGALCTAELKKKPRYAFQRADDVQAFGYTAGEEARADRFRQQNPEVELITPLIERGLTKADCLSIVRRAGLELPAMYRLGYTNNNCIGCVKGGMGYWNKIRRDFPDEFWRMAALEREIGHAILKDKNGPVYLDELRPKRGNYKAEPSIECSLLCISAETELSTPGGP